MTTNQSNMMGKHHNLTIRLQWLLHININMNNHHEDLFYMNHQQERGKHHSPNIKKNSDLLYVLLTFQLLGHFPRLHQLKHIMAGKHHVTN